MTAGAIGRLGQDRYRAGATVPRAKAAMSRAFHFDFDFHSHFDYPPKPRKGLMNFADTKLDLADNSPQLAYPFSLPFRIPIDLV